MVRKYSGIQVAGREHGTSIAFGYAAESYVDFGVPLMFLPPAIFGLLMGMAYAWFVRRIRYRELAVATVTVIFWLGLYLFERSTANMIGYAMSLIIYLGLPAVLLDKLLTAKSTPRRTVSPYLNQPIPEPTHSVDSLR
jgi:ABC-type proline/glycine betaine transport system permease subunit